MWAKLLLKTEDALQLPQWHPMPDSNKMSKIHKKNPLAQGGANDFGRTKASPRAREISEKSLEQNQIGLM